MSLYLIGIDVGSTTTSFLAIEARIQKAALAGTQSWVPIRTKLRPPRILTPLRGESRQQIDLEALSLQIGKWLKELGPGSHSAALLLTGIAARSENASQVVERLSAILENPTVAVAEDPYYESWLAFQGGVGALSRGISEAILNIDIGGGTTNLALGRGGEVEVTDWLPVGARHFQWNEKGKLLQVSPWGRELAARLEIDFQIGEALSRQSRQLLCSVYVDRIEAAIHRLSRGLSQPPLLTLSGGVGELFYQPSAHDFGDLGTELAEEVRRRLPISNLHPDQMGRATVYGITLSSTHLSGPTTFLAPSVKLPLHGVPILGLAQDATKLRSLLERARSFQCSTAIALEDFPKDDLLSAARDFGEFQFPICLLLSENLGRFLGNQISRWGKLPLPLVVLDEVRANGARFVNVGKPIQNNIPISFFGFNEEKNENTQTPA